MASKCVYLYLKQQKTLCLSCGLLVNALVNFETESIKNIHLSVYCIALYLFASLDFRLFSNNEFVSPLQ